MRRRRKRILTRSALAYLQITDVDLDLLQRITRDERAIVDAKFAQRKREQEAAHEEKLKHRQKQRSEEQRKNLAKQPDEAAARKYTKVWLFSRLPLHLVDDLSRENYNSFWKQ